MNSTRIHRSAAALLAALATGVALAAGPGPAAEPPGNAGAPAAAMPGPGPGPAASMGPGMQARQHLRINARNTPGWGLMTEPERQQHRDRLRNMHTQEECRAYVAQHHEEMATRAKARGQSVPAMPRRDPCQGLK